MFWLNGLKLTGLPYLYIDGLGEGGGGSTFWRLSPPPVRIPYSILILKYLKSSMATPFLLQYTFLIQVLSNIDINPRWRPRLGTHSSLSSHAKTHEWHPRSEPCHMYI